MKKSILCGFAAAASWGFSNVLIKALLAKFEPLSLLMLLLIASNLVLWIFLAFQPKSKLSLVESLRYSAPGLLQPGLAFIFGVFGLNLTTANSDSLLWATETIVVIFLAWFVLRELVSWYLLVLAILGICGTLMATTSSFDVHFNKSILLGNALVFAGVICASFYNIHTQRQLVNVEPLRLIALHQLSGLILVIGVWLICLPILGVSAKLSAFDFMLAIVGGITQYALPFFLYLIAIKDLGAARSSILLALPPVFTICGSFFFLGERLNSFQWVGVFIALVAVSGICVSRSTMLSETIVMD